MRIGVPKEIKAEESRVAITPAGVNALVVHGHQVVVERNAGAGSGLVDAEYRAAGAQVAKTARAVWESADMVLKVKEPLPAEYRYLREGLVVFTYLHLAASEGPVLSLQQQKVAAISYATIQLDAGSLPLLAPMSEIAGRLSVQMGSLCLEKQNGGAGILLSGASGVRPAKVVVLGAGIAGANACQIATGVGAHVCVIDINPVRLRYLHDILGGHITTVMSNRANIEEEVVSADLVIGSVLITGAKAPHLVSRKTVRAMKPGAAIVDISIDQGGCVATSRPTTHNAPMFVAERVVHYCVTNMPGMVPRTSTFALTNATLSYAMELADKGLQRAAGENAALCRGVNVLHGEITHAGVAAAFGLPYVAFPEGSRDRGF